MATEAEDFQSAQAVEYGQWVATEPIDIGGVRAFNPGDPVPASHITREVVSPGSVQPVGRPVVSPEED